MKNDITLIRQRIEQLQRRPAIERLEDIEQINIAIMQLLPSLGQRVLTHESKLALGKLYAAFESLLQDFKKLSQRLDATMKMHCCIDEGLNAYSLVSADEDA
ncbi:hypothetical protein [Rouxiella sp. WC2420]|uniref:Uncharacterized protein n=1 Tax=Rouxiella sp. WC2420 TaxID=3234145 RepID=A0AB39VTG9_9GAMM